MAHTYHTTFTVEYQQYHCENSEKYENEKRVLEFHSSQTSNEAVCPRCKGKVIGHGIRKVRLTDIPYVPGCPTVYEIHQHRYFCKECRKTFCEDNPFKAPGLNLTKRCVIWILELMKYKMPTACIAAFLGISWNTVRKLEKAKMDYILKERDEELRNSTYRPYYLAVDEFAIRKGHRYATCVMDLACGDILWVGKGRTIKDFTKFFEAFSGSDYLSEVKAVAMDMNASYNTLVHRFLPHAEIVYDRYHVQAQYGRDVLGQVRLEAAKCHKEKAKKMANDKSVSTTDVKSEKQLYSQIKKARWVLLQNHDTLSQKKAQKLNEILETHSDLALCYAMKEEMLQLFQITDADEAHDRWTKWFDAAIQSGIPPLMKFARQKYKRLDGLIAHAKFHINTGKLEGFNNKIKVAKRNAYGFRNLDFFFTYIRFLSIPHGVSAHQKF